MLAWLAISAVPDAGALIVAVRAIHTVVVVLAGRQAGILTTPVGRARTRQRRLALSLVVAAAGTDFDAVDAGPRAARGSRVGIDAGAVLTGAGTRRITARTALATATAIGIVVREVATGAIAQPCDIRAAPATQVPRLVASRGTDALPTLGAWRERRRTERGAPSVPGIAPPVGRSVPLPLPLLPLLFLRVPWLPLGLTLLLTQQAEERPTQQTPEDATPRSQRGQGFDPLIEPFAVHTRLLRRHRTLGFTPILRAASRSQSRRTAVLQPHVQLA